LARLAYIRAEEYTTLPAASIKIWLWLAWRHPKGTAKVCLVDLAMAVGMGERKARSALRLLARAGVLTFESSTNGYEIHLPYSNRFTFVHDRAVPALLRLPDRATKVFVAIARLVDNTSRARKAPLGTIAKLAGRCSRTVQMAVEELAGAMLVRSVRTGRSSIFILQDAAPDEALAPPVAHHSDLLLRLLRSTPEQELSRILGRGVQDGKDLKIRDALVVPEPGIETKTLERALRHATGSLDKARALLSRFRPRELWNGLERVQGRKLRDPYRYLEKVMRRGWCAA